MKALFLICVSLAVFSGVAFADQYVRGHYRDTDGDGIKDTYINPYYRTSPNSTTLDNYNTKGNYNPYTGKEGTIDPYKSTNPYDYNSGSQKHRYGY